jgi:NOL1/NOP2/sun family putative RNA methylase
MKLPEAFCTRMKNMLGSEYDSFERVFTTEPPYTAIRINSSKTGARERILGVTGSLDGVAWCGDGYYADKSVISGKHPYHFAGLFYFQEPSAMTVAEAADIQRGDFVLDLCAAPGGKSTHVLSRLGSSGLLVANEISKKRASVLAENIERFGALNTLVTNEPPEKLTARFGGFFDKIIVDSPCSGEGMFRKEPQAIDEWSEAHTLSCAARSRGIVDCAVKMLKQGGRLIYSTCTFAPCENEGIVSYILSSYPDMTLINPTMLSMLDCGKGEYIGSDADFSYSKRVFPHKSRGEGHFVAVFEKNGSCSRTEFKVKQKKADISDALALYRSFERDALNITLDGNFTVFGENLYRLPDGIDCVDGLKVVRAGLHLGVCKKGRFEPSQSLALALDKSAFVSVCDLPADSSDMKAYLRGEATAYDGSGWTCVCADGYPLGWGKASQGILKNHFPKHLRVI